MKKARSKWSRVLLTVTLIALTGVCLLIMATTRVHLWKVFATDSPETIAAIRANFSQELVFSLLGVAISVWIGLNIYNVLSKEDLQALMEKTEETAEKVTEEAYTEVLISKLRLMPADRMENYLAGRFVEMDRFPCEILKQIVLLEDKFNYAYAMYVAGSATKDLKPITALIHQLETVTKSYSRQRTISEEQKDFLRGYIALRRADFAFFSVQNNGDNMSVNEKICCAEEMIKNYHTVLDLFFHAQCAWDSYSYTSEECQGIALIYNSICAAYLVFFPWKEGEVQNQEQKRKILKDAIWAGEEAIKYASTVQPGIRAVFLRNLGVAYERSGDWMSALRFYNEAYSLNPTNPKILHCIASWYRKRAMVMQSNDKREFLQMSAYWYCMEFIHKGGNIVGDDWLKELKSEAQKSGYELPFSQGLREFMEMGHDCREAMKKYTKEPSVS